MSHAKANKTNDARYLSMIVQPIRVCASYKPKMGQEADAGLTLAEFQTLYRADPFYSWFGLDHPLMYAAHKAAGGMTSVYRQIGIGVEHLFRQILRDCLGLTDEQSRWAYDVSMPSGKVRTLSLDGRINLADISNVANRKRVSDWVQESAQDLGVEYSIRKALKGAVFEVRQGYKSKDSKRQNADIANASTAYTQAYLPCCVVLSAQIDSDIIIRYRSEKWAILTGATRSKSPHHSTYAFSNEVLRFDLAAFFERNSKVLRREVGNVLHALLSAEG